MVWLKNNAPNTQRFVPSFVLKNKMKFPILFDQNNRISGLYQGFPTTVIVDHKGMIRDWIVRATNYSTLEEKVKNLLNEE